MAGNANQAKVYGIFGATGCGKTTRLVKLLNAKKRKRTVIWSPKEPIDNYAGLYPGSVIVRSATEVFSAAKAAGAKGSFHLVYVPRLNRKIDEQQFDIVSKILVAARDVTFVVDEMHTVVLPSWSPDGWNQLVMMGRGYGAELFGLSQRPASVDKNFFSNLSTVQTGRLNYNDDVKVMAGSLRVPVAEVQALIDFQYINRDILTGKTTRG